eukprot:10211720-Lingulodinium_polyedra.AAC.1
MATSNFPLASPMDPHTESIETTWQQMNGDQWGRMRANGEEQWKAVESSGSGTLRPSGSLPRMESSGEQWRAVES